MPVPDFVLKEENRERAGPVSLVQAMWERLRLIREVGAFSSA